MVLFGSSKAPAFVWIVSSFSEWDLEDASPFSLLLALAGTESTPGVLFLVTLLFEFCGNWDLFCWEEVLLAVDLFEACRLFRVFWSTLVLW